MSIRLIARDLYRLRQEVERLKREVEKASLAERPGLEDTLRKARAERERLQRMLDGNKEPPAYRHPR